MNHSLTLNLPVCRHCHHILDYWWRVPGSDMEQALYAAIRANPETVRAYDDTCCMPCYTAQAGWFPVTADAPLPAVGQLVQIVDTLGFADLGYFDGLRWNCWQDPAGRFTPPAGQVVWFRAIELAAPPHPSQDIK